MDWCLPTGYLIIIMMMMILLVHLHEWYLNAPPLPSYPPQTAHHLLVIVVDNHQSNMASDSGNASGQIRQMVNFILQEAHEKANEIRIKVGM